MSGRVGEARESGLAKRCVVVPRSVDVVATPLSGCLLVRPPVHRDRRGFFTKSVGDDVRAAIGEDFEVAEVYWSISRRGVIRGMHFQAPPCSVRKLIWVSDGRIRDVVIDIRSDSPTFGRWADFSLEPGSGSVFVPHGCAHGFEVLSESATVFYAQDGAFCGNHDAGVRWDVEGLPWGTIEPVVSDRDARLPEWSSFRSPYSVGGGECRG